MSPQARGTVNQHCRLNTQPVDVAPGTICPGCNRAIWDGALIMRLPSGSLVHASCWCLVSP